MLGNKLDTERQAPHVISHMWKLRNSGPENRIVITKDWKGTGGGAGRLEECYACV